MRTACMCGSILMSYMATWRIHTTLTGVTHGITVDIRAVGNSLWLTRAGAPGADEALCAAACKSLQCARQAPAWACSALAEAVQSCQAIWASKLWCWVALVQQPTPLLAQLCCCTPS
ncbi:hypothetical protein COO60DRAFT_1576606 [Scenedesmus sp. NREL 46B-D3]|nr:hypothetical protein COO60DRAFT_1576606 [Scenedesmus sp. NREL 46B-D3]